MESYYVNPSSISPLDLLAIDELGYENLTRETANLFFQVVAKRYEHGSIILTSNKPFEDWGTLFGGDDIVAIGLLDRLLHHSHNIVTDGPSYRTKDKMATLKKRSASCSSQKEEEK